MDAGRVCDLAAEGGGDGGVAGEGREERGCVSEGGGEEGAEWGVASFFRGAILAFDGVYYGCVFGDLVGIMAAKHRHCIWGSVLEIYGVCSIHIYIFKGNEDW